MDSGIKKVFDQLRESRQVNEKFVRDLQELKRELDQGLPDDIETWVDDGTVMIQLPEPDDQRVADLIFSAGRIQDPKSRGGLGLDNITPRRMNDQLIEVELDSGDQGRVLAKHYDNPSNIQNVKSYIQSSSMFEQSDREKLGLIALDNEFQVGKAEVINRGTEGEATHDFNVQDLVDAVESSGFQDFKFFVQVHNHPPMDEELYPNMDEEYELKFSENDLNSTEYARRQMPTEKHLVDHFLVAGGGVYGPVKIMSMRNRHPDIFELNLG